MQQFGKIYFRNVENKDISCYKNNYWELSNDSFEHTLNEVRAVTADSSLFSVALFIESKLSLSPPLIESKLSTVAKKVKIAS